VGLSAFAGLTGEVGLIDLSNVPPEEELTLPEPLFGGGGVL